MGCANGKPTEEDGNSPGDATKASTSPDNGVQDERLQFLAHVRLFQRLPKDEHPSLAKAMSPTTFEPGRVIIKQGDEGHEFYVIKRGECVVTVDEAKVATLKQGDFFGENALLREEPRTATITASTKVEALCVSRAQFEKLGLNTKLEFPKRGAVAGGAGAKVEKKDPSPKTKEEEKTMINALKANQNLATMAALDDSKMQAMIEVMWKEAVPAGTEIIKQGDLNADYFYIIMDGEFEVAVAQQGGQSEQGALIGTLGVGQSFGELALMYLAPRAATVKAKNNAEVMIIDRVQFKGILSAAAQGLSKQYIKYLDKVELLNPLKDKEKEELAEALNEMSFAAGEQIFAQGEKGDYFYILIEGSVDVIKDSKKVTTLTATAEQAQIFGERALLNAEPRAATITVTSQAIALAVDKASFDMLLGPLDELKKRGKTGTAVVKKVGPTAGAGGEKRYGKILRKELKRLGLLGCGGFGVVEMVEHVKTTDTYALKALSKGYVVKSGMQQSVMSEKNVQIMCDSQFIVKLHETFNGEQSLYFLLELALGGELYATYNKKNLWGREDCAKFYVAGTTYAFEHLHSKKIVFRDLKPENLLLNDAGQVKLTDMGLAKVVIGKTFTTCGTPDYFAPELIASKGHSHAVDWWTLGILTFELLSGHPPFESATPMQIYQKVTKGINRVSFPKKCKGSAEPLIKGLCNTQPSERLPMKKGDIKNIKDHAWFTGFDWDAMFNFKMPAPYKPVVKSKKDAANFNARKEDMPPTMAYKDDKTGWDKDFATST
mmetsp:Transcript_141388/g.439422  ORF Transcript_141388/g.439422 Transcript_141388/m.439422 type:complete len:775 (-) Transcript_141388:36-2360(-)|eukprot:CAMPEP_0204588758 /NCGR_PEP_ID=MMETSP0661-20131031/48797_1 /ASSEMBLY_ACC=CAM_ASM_000606 /TAXON_ID=109239 /ORGANISM="Alexandrium margalefi, Strain AMGDE01CS-322" /LENGTH=774 /DNA_ID=CAMNT_0051598597 /DNA_START=65 /DNA_END=2389 /DNA_ORIENTATION=-